MKIASAFQNQITLQETKQKYKGYSFGQSRNSIKSITNTKTPGPGQYSPNHKVHETELTKSFKFIPEKKETSIFKLR